MEDESNTTGHRPRVTFRPLLVSLRGLRQSPILPFVSVGWTLLSLGCGVSACWCTRSGCSRGSHCSGTLFILFYMAGPQTLLENYTMLCGHCDRGCKRAKAREPRGVQQVLLQSVCACGPLFCLQEGGGGSVKWQMMLGWLFCERSPVVGSPGLPPQTTVWGDPLCCRFSSL